MRVLLVTDWPPVEGGTERYVLQLRDGLRRAGDEVRLLTSTAGSRAGNTADYVAHGSRTAAGRAITQVVNPAARSAARRAVSDFQPDVAHLNMFLSYLSPSVVAGLGDVPAVLSLHDYRAVCRPSDARGSARALGEVVRRPFVRRALGRAAAILSCSAWMQRTFSAAGISSQTVPLPVEAPEDGQECRADHPVFVYGGRLDPEKGVDVLLRAFAAVRRAEPAAELRICGDGSARAELERTAHEIGIPVSFVRGMDPGWWRHARGAWAAVVPSVWEEPFGLVAAEAILRGIPVIAAASGALPETVSEGRTGTFFPRADAEALAARMLAVARGEALRTPVPSGERDRIARRHRPEAHIDRVREIYAGVTA